MSWASTTFELRSSTRQRKRMLQASWLWRQPAELTHLFVVLTHYHVGWDFGPDLPRRRLLVRKRSGVPRLVGRRASSVVRCDEPRAHRFSNPAEGRFLEVHHAERRCLPSDMEIWPQVDQFMILTCIGG